MYKKIGVKSVFFAFIIVNSIGVCQAQNVQNFINNEENQIQQDASAGAINSKQASALQNRQAQIMYQEQQDMNQNGGSLTQQEKRQIAGEERGVSQGVNGAMYQNNPNAAAVNGLQNKYPNTGWNQNNFNPQAQQNWRNMFNQNQSTNVNNQANQYNGQQSNGQPHRHHQQWQNSNY